MQPFTGTPSARTVHCEHCPFAQNIPCGDPSAGWCPNILIPAAISADEIISPCRAMTWRPFQ
jgi:hypothetical protein